MNRLTAAMAIALVSGAAVAQTDDPIGDAIRSQSGAYIHEQNGGNPATIHNQNTYSAEKQHYINSGGSEDVYNDIHVPESNPQASPYPQALQPIGGEGFEAYPY